MRIHLKTLFTASALIIGLGVSLTGCQTIATVFGTEVSQDVRQNAYKGALLAFSVWADGVQPAILVYGHRPTCAPEVTVICKNQKTWDKIKAIELTTSHMIETTRPVITGGTTDIELITSVAAAVWDAKSQLEAAKAEPKEQ